LSQRWVLREQAKCDHAMRLTTAHALAKGEDG
jgi:hypothetical protein